MRIYNRYILYLVATMGLVNVALAFLGQDDISVYFVLNLIVHLVITLLFVHFNPRARRALSSVSVVLFAGFMAIVTLKVVEILSDQ